MPGLPMNRWQTLNEGFSANNKCVRKSLITAEKIVCYNNWMDALVLEKVSTTNGSPLRAPMRI